MAQCQEYCQSHADYDCRMNQLHDFSGVTQVDITPAGMWGVINGRVGAAGGKVALVVATNLGFGLGRMFENMQDGAPLDVHVFREREAALRWLNLKLEDWPWKEKSEGNS